jgi:phage-related protein
VFIKLTMTAIGPAIGKSLSPIADGFRKAGVEAGKLASKGVAPLAAQFNKLGMPIISAQMNRISVATNGVVKGFLNWAKSKAGIASLRGITRATATAFEKVAPHVLKLGTALGEMIGRIAGVSLAAGSTGLVGVLDKVTAKLKTINAHTVRKGLEDLKSAFTSIKDAVVTVGGAISKVIAFYQKYKTQINLLSDAFAVFAIVFGGPVTAIIAAVGLVIRHFDTFKAAFLDVKAALSAPGSLGIIDQLRGAVQTVVPAVVAGFNMIKAAVLPTLTKMFAQIKTEVIPAFAEFVVAMAPVVKFFVERLAPVVAVVFGTIVKVISGALTIITGIFKIATGILTGNWSKTWAGIKQVLRGALAIVKALIGGAFALIKAGFSNARAIISGIWRGMWALVKSAASSAKSQLVSIAASIAIAFRDKFNQIKTAISSKMREAKSAVVNAIQGIKNAVSNIDLGAAGRRIIQTLINGIKSMIPSIGGVMSGIAGKIGGFLPGSPIKAGPLKSWNNGGAGKRLVDLLAGGIASRQRSLAGVTANAAGVVAGAFTNMPTGTGTGTGAVVAGGLTVNFNGVVGDPVAVGREIERVWAKYLQTQGRAVAR